MRPVHGTNRRRIFRPRCWRRPCWRLTSSRSRARGDLSNDTNSGNQPVPVPDREGLGRSRGGVTTKIHLVADSRCRPIARVTTAGQRHDSVAFTAVMADISIKRSCGGRPRTRPDRVLADKAYSSKRIRNTLRCRGIKATIPEPSTQIAGRVSRGSQGGRPPKFDKKIYKTLTPVERAITRPRGQRAVAMRYHKREFVYKGTTDVASIGI